jgi:simple sugar transport system permease protein
VSDTVERTSAVAGGQPARPNGAQALTSLRRAGLLMLRQREATVFLVVVLLVAYFGFVNSIGRATFFGQVNLAALCDTWAPIIIIALGEVLLLVCGEIDLSVGFVYAFTPFIMYFLIVNAGVPGILAIIISLLFAVAVGAINGFLTVTLGVPSFVATLGTGFILGGLVLTTNNDEQATPPTSIAGNPDTKVTGFGHWLGSGTFSMIIWAVALTVVFHFLLRRTRWGLHTIAVGGNPLGAAEAGVNVARIKYGNFMLCALLGGLTGIMIGFETGVIDTFSGGAGYVAMFYGVAAAVIGGTAMLGGSGTMIGAFLGAAMLAVLTDGLSDIGVSANPLNIYFGAAILVAMTLNVTMARLRSAGRIRR